MAGPVRRILSIIQVSNCFFIWLIKWFIYHERISFQKYVSGESFIVFCLISCVSSFLLISIQFFTIHATLYVTMVGVKFIGTMSQPIVTNPNDCCDSCITCHNHLETAGDTWYTNINNHTLTWELDLEYPYYVHTGRGERVDTYNKRTRGIIYIHIETLTTQTLPPPPSPSHSHIHLSFLSFYPLPHHKH